nr:hypothetical protein [Tanacetum cinerariifolium]
MREEIEKLRDEIRENALEASTSQLGWNQEEQSTIFNDLFHTILAPDSTAQQACDRLKTIFQDNKHSRALYLEQQFTNLRLENFSNVSAYCQELKVLADQLSNVGSPISDDRLARSRLILEETHKQKQAATNATTSGSTLLTTTFSNNSKVNQSGGSNHSQNKTGYVSFNNTNSTSGCGCGHNTNGHGRGGRGRGHGYNSNTNRTPYPGQQHQPWGPYGSWTWQHQSWTPHHVLTPLLTWYAPTDIDAAMHTMTLNPLDENWYMDTSATSHMTTSPGTLLPYINLSCSNNIIVRNGNGIPVHGYDNNISLEFDPFGFTMKEFLKTTSLMKCNSSRDLSPLFTTMLCQLKSPSTFAALSQDLWHHLPRTPDMHVIRSMWIFRHKMKPDGSFECYKARLVGDGRSQQLGVDCNKTFSLIVKPVIIQTLLSIALSKSWSIHQLDVKNAFLHVTCFRPLLACEFAMKDLGPLGYFSWIAVTRHQHGIFLSQKNYAKDIIARVGMSSCNSVHTPIDTTSKLSATSGMLHMTVICMLVKGILRYLQGTLDYGLHLSKSSIHRLVAYMDTDWGGCPDTRELYQKDRSCIYLYQSYKVGKISQKNYAKDIIARVGMSSCNSVHTPIDTTSKLSATSGMLHMTVICMLVKGILRYLQGTLDYGLHLSKSSIHRLVAYMDTDWGGCPDT